MDAPKSNKIIWLVALFIGVAFILFVAFNFLWDYRWRDTTPRGPLIAVADWPEPIRELHATLNESGADTRSFSVYLLYGKPGQILSTVVCRVAVDDAGWHVIRTKLELQPIPDADGESVRSSIVQLSDSTWWAESSATVTYFASARRLAGDEADLYYAARDSKSKLAYVHYDFNF